MVVKNRKFNMKTKLISLIDKIVSITCICGKKHELSYFRRRKNKGKWIYYFLDDHECDKCGAYPLTLDYN